MVIFYRRSVGNMKFFPINNIPNWATYTVTVRCIKEFTYNTSILGEYHTILGH
jgi:hypothetical protein